MKVEKLRYVAPAVESCRVELEGVVAETVPVLEFDPGENNIDNWTETVLGDAVNPKQGQGGDVFIGPW
jgi:hypothetical protein